jgi:hypothetical protein
MKSLTYVALVCLILKYRAACWDPFREEQINVLQWVQNKADKFVNLTNNSNWGKVGMVSKASTHMCCNLTTLSFVCVLLYCILLYCIVMSCLALYHTANRHKPTGS